MMEQIRAKKHLGQNFLKDENIIEEIFSIAKVNESDWVFEIGPGTGALTFPLVGRVEKYLALEFDHELAHKLQTQFTDAKKVIILQGNILDTHLETILKDAGFGEHPYKIIANIPYYITAPIIRRMLSLKMQPTSMTLMVQDEVAKRLAAKPGAMSLLSVMAQYYATVEKKCFVPKEAFDPVPQVDSAVIEIIPKRLYDAKDDRRVFRLVRAGFAARRKTLVNNLMTSFSLSRSVVEKKLALLPVRSDVRAQALSVEEWQKLAEIWEA